MVSSTRRKRSRPSSTSDRWSSLNGPPLSVGSRVYGCCTDNVNRKGIVLKVRSLRVGDDTSPVRHRDAEYYIRYENVDRRLDGWMLSTQLSCPSPDSDVDSPNQEKAKISENNDAASESDYMESIKNIEKIQLGNHEMMVWYPSPYPEDYTKTGTMILCENCLSYHSSSTTAARHRQKCGWQTPPGQEIYRSDHVSVHEVQGCQHEIYSQNLCLLSKLFLEHKSLCSEVSTFVFYVMTKRDESGHHIMGYYSKERVGPNNLSCILVLPPYQQLGFGQFLISLSYELSKLEGKVGGPETPLSDLGRLGYESYWKQSLLNFLQSELLVHTSKSQYRPRNVEVKYISQATAIREEECLATLRQLKLLTSKRRDNFVVYCDQTLSKVENAIQHLRPPKQVCDPRLIRWQPNDS